jgi:hypothetical protein
VHWLHSFALRCVLLGSYTHGPASPDGGSEAEDGADRSGSRAAAQFGIGGDQLEGMRNVFNTFDLDSDGIVMAREIGELLSSLNLVPSKRMLREIVNIVDIDGDGRIDFGEFVSLMARVKTEADRQDEEPDEEDDFDRPPPPISLEEQAKQKFRQEALATFQRAVTIMAFQQVSGVPAGGQWMRGLDDDMRGGVGGRLLRALLAIPGEPSRRPRPQSVAGSGGALCRPSWSHA